MLKINYNYFLSFITSTFFVISINVNPNKLFEINLSYLSLIRFFLPLFGVLYFYYLSKTLITKVKLNKNNILLFLIFLLFLITELINGISPNTLYLLNFLLFFFYINLLCQLKDDRILVFNFLTLIIVYCILIFGIIILGKLGYTSISKFNPVEFFDLRNYYIFQEKNFIFSDTPSPNSTGFSRIILIIFLILIYYDFKKKRFSKLLFATLVCLNLIILSLQSKFSALGGIIIYFLLLFCDDTYLKKKIFNTIFVILLPILIFNYVQTENRFLSVWQTINNADTPTNNKILETEITTKKMPDLKKNNLSYQNNFRKEYYKNTTTNITTGRNLIWNTQLKYIHENKIYLLGKGVYSDLKIFNTSSSNAAIYTILSGGIIPFSLLLIIYLNLAIKFINFLYKKIKRKIFSFNEIYFLILILLILRSLIENSFLSIQMDFYMVVLLIEIAEKNNLKNSKYISNII